MKKAFVFLCAFAALFACSKNELPAPPDNGTDQEETASFTFHVTVDAPQTKAQSKSVWEGGDIIYVKFQGINSKYLTLTYNAGTFTWDAAQSTPFTEYDFDGAGSRICHAIYFPIDVTASFTEFNSKPILEFVTAAEAWPATYYLEHQDVSYSVSGTDVTFNLRMTIPANSVQFHIPGLQTTFTNYNFRVSNVLARQVRGIQDDGINHTLPSGPLAGFADAEGVVYSGYIVSPGSELDYYFYLCSKTQADSYTIFEKTRALTSGSFYKFKSLDDASHMWKTTRLIGKFSVSAEKKVHFSQGNLQYVGSWQFATNQWDSFGASQSDDHRDLLGWGTKTTPNTVINDSEYYSWAEWGENAITNGGNAENFGWRTLSRAEWGYLLGVPESEFTTHRADAASKYGFATVNGIQGLILLPDGTWTSPAMDVDHKSFGDNTITSSDWLTYWEPKGAVFLPVTGSRLGTEVSHTDEGLYWSSTEGAYGISAVSFTGSTVYNDPPALTRTAGFAVRLVRDVGFNF